MAAKNVTRPVLVIPDAADVPVILMQVSLLQSEVIQLVINVVDANNTSRQISGTAAEFGISVGQRNVLRGALREAYDAAAVVLAGQLGTVS
jgi:hypothetical protein